MQLSTTRRTCPISSFVAPSYSYSRVWKLSVFRLHCLPEHEHLTYAAITDIVHVGLLTCQRINLFIQCCVHCCGLQMFHVSASFLLLSLFGRIVSSQSSLSDHRPMFVLVSLFLVCLPVFLLLLSAEYHNVLMCFSLCGPHKTTVCFSGCLTYTVVVPFIQIFCNTSLFVECELKVIVNILL